MNGIIIIDKPADWTSHDVVAKLRGALKEKHIGHGGTLDPMATGVLPVFIGRATRAVEYCESFDKTYIAGLKLGIVTDTQDITGNILCAHPDFPRHCERREAIQPPIGADDILAILPKFLGHQKQIPPMYSAVKIGGERLYKLARRGIEVERPPRDIYISEIDLMGSSSSSEYMLKITCSKGTYVRTICHDIGAALGCGAVMSSLRRTRVGAFTIENAHTLDEILAPASANLPITSHSTASATTALSPTASTPSSSAPSPNELSQLVMPVDTIFSSFPTLTFTDAETRKSKNGVPCHRDGLADGRYRVYSPDNEFLLFAEAVAGTVESLKSFYHPTNP